MPWCMMFMVRRPVIVAWQSSRSLYKKWIRFAKRRRIRWLEQCRFPEELRVPVSDRVRPASSLGRRGRDKEVIGKEVGREMTLCKTMPVQVRKAVLYQGRIGGTRSCSRKLTNSMGQSRELRVGQIRATLFRSMARRSNKTMLLTRSFSNKIEILAPQYKAVLM